MVSKNYKKVCTALNYMEYLLILASAVSGCVSVSAFASLVGISKDITDSAAAKIVRLKTVR